MFIKVIGPSHKTEVSGKLKAEMSNAMMTQTHCVNKTTERSKRKQAEKVCESASISAPDSTKIAHQVR